MAVKKIYGNISVVDAARQRVRNVFSNGTKVYMSFSAGKDSLCMSRIVYDLILRGEVDPKQLTVLFVDEESIYESMEQMAMRWRKRFMSVGAEFRWYCLPLKQVSILHHLQNDERWITWEPGKENVWIRNPPPFAIRSSPYLSSPGEMNYQNFCSYVTKDGIQLLGVRACESVQRMQYIANICMSAGNLTGRQAVYPIYDWADTDVWLYIKDHNLDFPDAYIDLYRTGRARNRLRLSNFFAAETVQSILNVAETDPELWRKIEAREPNAYMVLLYWDSELFKRQSRKRTALEGDTGKDYRQELKRMLFAEFSQRFMNPGTQHVGSVYKRFFIRYSDIMQDADLKRMHDALVAGDPKLRSLRALYTSVFGAYADRTRADVASRKGVNADGRC